jgi:predicted RNA-binding Zn-ribbon protein involved in translation (DUF1610 family)
MNDDKKSGSGPGEWQSRYWDRRQFNERKFLKTGSYLDCYCPHCGQSIIEDKMARFEIVAPDGQVGSLSVTPYLNVYERHTDITVPEGEEAKDLRCPHCHTTLVVPGRSCGRGDSRVGGILIAVGNSKVPFFFCMRVGCTWHEIHPDAADQIILDESREW